MSTVTKAIATEVAIKLVAKKKEAIEKLEKELKSLTVDAYKKTVPKEVLDVFEKYPDYIRTSTYCSLSGHGWDWQILKFGVTLPKKNNSGTQFDAKTSEKLRKLFDKIQADSTKMRKTLHEIEVTLFNLRTYKRVEENFPEAFALLPAKITTALSTDVSTLRQEIKKVP